MDTNDQLEQHRARLAALRANYLKGLPQRLERLDYLVRSIPVERTYREDGGELRSRLNITYQEFHKVAGSAGSVGLHAMSEAAKAVLQILDHWFTDATEEPLSKQGQILDLLSTMGQADDAGSESSDAAPRPESRTIHVVDDNPLTANEMQVWLEEAGFDAQVFMSATIYGDTFEVLPRPDLIIMDINFGDEPNAGPRIVDFLKQKLGNLPPVAFLSIRDDMEARLAALRAGSSRYLNKPVTRRELVELAHEYVDKRDASAFRVLMVDDDETTLSVTQAILERAGLEVCAIANPLDTLDAARNFNPDLFLLDVLMPEVSGTELAATLRQDRQFDVIPILFLTSDTHPDQKVMGAALGGDDFILKPFDPDYLLTAVMARARRSRRLREVLALRQPG